MGKPVLRQVMTFQVFALLWAVLVAAAPAEPIVWLEAEGFSNTGGWSNDSQFVDRMGSPYLLAAGVGRPVEDASTKVQIPSSGNWRVWVRCKDWLPSHSPGRFEVLLDGRPLEKTFGQAVTDDWQWVDGGQCSLAAGEVEIRLRDLTGWWGRCDAVVLAPSDFAPAGSAEALAEQRCEHGGVSREIEDGGNYDVVVSGGGLAGCAAALAAARHGGRAVLIQDRPVLGGNSSSEIRVPVQGDRSRDPWDPLETGIIEEFYPSLRGTAQSRRVEEIVTGNEHVELRLNTRVTGVEMKDAQTIAAVLALDVRSGQRVRFSAPLFIDCTGHGWVGYWAGADWRMGEEARSEHNEPSAPREATEHTMGNNLHAAEFRTHVRPIAFEAPPWAYRWESADQFEPADSNHRLDFGRPPSFDMPSHGKGRRPGDKDTSGGIDGGWQVESGGMLNTIDDAEEIRDELFRINIGLWDYAKNHNPQVAGFNANRELVWLNHVMGTRESRRLLGDYVLSENDYLDRTFHPDNVAFTGWGADIHHPEGFWIRGTDVMHYYRHKVSIPLRSLYSRNISNLLMAGRCLSTTHIGMGGTRIMRSCCLTGQAAGTAAALAARHGCTPRDIYKAHLGELQQSLLKDGCYLMGIANQDPGDLARRAQITASSTANVKDISKPVIEGGLVQRLNRRRAVMFTAAEERVDSVALFLENDSDRPVHLGIALRAASGVGDFSATADLARAEAEVPARNSGWVEFPLCAALKAGRCYSIHPDPQSPISWHLYPTLMAGCSSGHWASYGDVQPTPFCYRFRLTPGGEPTEMEQPEPLPENVVNGWNRAVAGVRNAWIPALNASSPHWIQFALPDPAEVASLHVSFQTRDDVGVDFDVQAMAGGTWQTVGRVRGNDQRRRVIELEPVRTTQIRLLIHKTAGQFGICEVRLYESSEL